MKLSDYMADNGLSDDQVAEAVGSDRTTISRIRREKQRPSWQLAEALVKFSGGKLTYPELGQVQQVAPANGTHG